MRATQTAGRPISEGVASAPNVARWFGDIRTYLPSGVVRVMQKDALKRVNLRQMLLEPEMLAAAEPDVHLVATLISLRRQDIHLWAEQHGLKLERAEVG
jgi:hypothetical protein